MSENSGRRRVNSSPSVSDSKTTRHLVKEKYRIVVMGAACVGKTCLVSRFLYQEFVSQYKATVEEFHSGKYEIDGRPLTLDILDTSGTYEFPAMRQLSIATGDAFILVYSLEDGDSFELVKDLRQQILDVKEADTPIVIVANKVDLSRPPISLTQRTTQETTVAIDWGHGYVEASAKDDINIGAVFRELLTQAKISLGEETVVKRCSSLKGKNTKSANKGKSLKGKNTKSANQGKPLLGKRNSANCVIS